MIVALNQGENLLHVTPDKERLAIIFTELCEIASPSRQEKAIATRLFDTFSRFHPTAIFFDNSGATTGSDTGNLIVRFAENSNNLKEKSNKNEGLFFTCHMDTVTPTTEETEEGVSGIRVKREGNIFTSRGNTILGADDKTGIAACIEMVHLLHEHKIHHRPFELLFTTCEEIGLLGSKALDTTLLQSRFGYALDSAWSDVIIIGAPAANRIIITIQGQAAHAGIDPESGINALAIAADALAHIPQGRISSNTTVNFGIIRGGTASHIVPDRVVLEGEIRSHNDQELQALTEHIRRTFIGVTENWPLPAREERTNIRPSTIVDIHEDFPLMQLSDKDAPLKHLRHITIPYARNLAPAIAGGGSDASILCKQGLPTAILPAGMSKVHSCNEQADLQQMVKTVQLLLEMVRP